MIAELHLVGLAKLAFCVLLFGVKAFVAACAVLLALWFFGCPCWRRIEKLVWDALEAYEIHQVLKRR